MQHVQRMRRISTPRTRAESDFAECSDASLPPPFFFIPLPPSRIHHRTILKRVWPMMHPHPRCLDHPLGPSFRSEMEKDVQISKKKPLKKDFSGWRPAIAFLYLFLFHSLLRLTSFLSQYKNWHIMLQPPFYTLCEPIASSQKGDFFSIPLS